MPVPVREQILQNLVATLAGLAGVRVERDLEAEVQDYPTLNVIEGDQSADSGTHGATDYRMAVTVEGYVQTPGRDTLAAANNDLYARVVRALNDDYTLGGFAQDVTETAAAFDVDRDGMETPTAYFAVEFEIRYFTRQGDPYAVGPS
ncbi:hypothetical protein [Paludisphaera rhizosphaerae]|uniref:hypothetical protein n=1 Tax=Paludisphaera rhizosphaerae TaxID=2711216 RepID=UPI0013EB65C6|nr:hypothetical protein [Paludisphaera rhizosphaerae]